MPVGGHSGQKTEIRRDDLVIGKYVLRIFAHGEEPLQLLEEASIYIAIRVEFQTEALLLRSRYTCSNVSDTCRGYPLMLSKSGPDGVGLVGRRR